MMPETALASVNDGEDALPDEADNNRKDLQLVGKEGRGEQRDFQDVYAKHHRLVRAVVARLLRYRYEFLIDDVCQEAWMKIHKYLDRYDAKRGAKFSTWIGIIAMNIARDRLRSEMRSAPTDGFESVNDSSLHRDNMTPEEMLMATELLGIVDAVLEGSPVRRKVFAALFMGESPENISRRLGISLKTVYSACHKARRKIWQALKAAVDIPIEKAA